MVLPDLVKKEGAYRAAPELSQDLYSVFLLPSKDGNSPWLQSLLGKMSMAPINGVLLPDALMSAGVAEPPLLDPPHGSADVQHICHQVIPKSSRMHQSWFVTRWSPKSSRMHQEWPELSGLYCAPLCQATGSVNSQESKKQFLAGWLGSWLGPCVRPCLCSVCVNPMVGAGEGVGQLHTASLTFPGPFARGFQSEDWSVGSLHAVLPYWCSLNTLVQESKAWRGALCSLTFGRISWEVLQWLGSERDRTEILLHPSARLLLF